MRRSLALGAVLLCGVSIHAVAQDGKSEPILRGFEPIIDLRLRYEVADFSNFPDKAEALTLRSRIGVQTPEFWGTRLLVEMDHVEAFEEDYNSVTNGRTNFPVIADPEVTELNRLQLRNTSLPNTVVTLGRQRIIQDGARFVGNVGWRQDEQTYDALRVQTKPVDGLSLDVSYVDQVNRIFGDESPISKFESDSWLVHGAYDAPSTGDATARIGGYAYLLDLEADRLSSQTYGVNATLGYGPVKGRVEYAVQSDYAGNPVDYSEDYASASLTYSQSGFTAEAGIEQLGGNGAIGFSTPLATAHKFNGFADVFLNTPTDGLRDTYVKAGYKTGPMGPLPFVNAFAVYHDFDAQAGGRDYGTEVDAVVATKIKNVGVLFKYGEYNADGFATDRTRYSVQFDVKF
ncbi:MAG: hypothetical protein WBG08_00110 [Litorimonas sp.]